jgi:hypothetical protein
MQHGELLPEGKDFQSSVSPTTKKDPDYRGEGEDNCGQELHSAT